MRVRIYALIVLVLTVIVVVETVGTGPRAILPVLACSVGGLVVGIVASRMFSPSRDSVGATVVGRLEVIGGVVLVGHLAFSVLRGDLPDLWFDGRCSPSPASRRCPASWPGRSSAPAGDCGRCRGSSRGTLRGTRRPTTSRRARRGRRRSG